MEFQKQADNEPDFVLDNRKLVLIFFGFLAICGCFFIVGYVLGSGATPQHDNYADAGAAGNTRINDHSGSEAHNRMNEIVSERSSAAIETAPAGTAVSASAGIGSEPGDLPEITTIVQAAAVSADKPKPQQETPGKTAKPPAGKTAAPPKQAASAKITYSVQVAAFRARSEAEIKVMELEARGFDPRIESPPPNDSYYRIKVGRFATRAEANEMANRLRRSGFETMISENKGN